MSQTQPYLDPIIKIFSTGEHYPDLYRAKQDYFTKNGPITEEDHEYESRMSLFFDWYLFDRELPKFELPPIEYYYQTRRENLSTEDRKIYQDFCHTIHSIYFLVRSSGENLQVKNLFTGDLHLVSHVEIPGGFQKGDIFEARLIPFQNQWEFSKGFCFHPVEAEDFILGEIEKLQKKAPLYRDYLIQDLSAMKLKHSRFSHIPLKYIYSYDPKI